MPNIIEALSAVITSNESATFLACDASPPTTDNPVVRLQLASDAAELIQSFGMTFLQGVVAGLHDGSLVEKPYDPASITREHEIDVVNLDDDLGLAAAVEPYTRGTDARTFNKDRDALRQFNLSAVAFQGSKKAKPVVLFKKQSQPSEIRSKRKVRIFSSKNVFDKVDTATFLFDDYFDAIHVAGKLLVFKKERFHIMFGYYEGLKQFVKDALPTLCATVPIANFAELESACLADKALMKRLRRTMAAMPPNFNPVRFATMIAKDSIPIKVAGTKAKPTFVFQKGGRHDFFTLLEDGFLNSSATDRLYEANSKRTRQLAK